MKTGKPAMNSEKLKFDGGETKLHSVSTGSESETNLQPAYKQW